MQAVYRVLIIYTLFTSVCYSQVLRLDLDYKTAAQSTTDSTITIIRIDFKSLSYSLDSISDQLSNKGYISHLVTPITLLSENHFTSLITLNSKIDRLLLLTNSIDSTKVNGITLSRKRDTLELPLNEITAFLNNLNLQEAQKGNAFYSVNLSAISINDQTAIATLKESSTRRRFIDALRLKGYEKLSQRIIKRVLPKNLLFTPDNVELVEQRIKAIPFIEQVRNPEVLFKKDSTIMYAYVKKKSLNTAEGILGFNNNDGDFQITGNATLNLFNNLNNGERFKIIYRSDDGEQTHLNANLEIPYVFNSPIGARGSLQLIRRDSTYQNTATTAGVFYTPRWGTSIGANYYSNSSNATDDTTNVTAQDFTTNGVELDISYSKLKRNLYSFFNSQDWYANFKIGYQIRENDINDVNQWRLDATISKSLHLNKSNQIWIRVHGQLLDTDDLLFNELFQMGGTNSIRGFNPNSIDSSRYITLMTEYRYILSPSLYVHSIIDAGIFEQFMEQENKEIVGLGAGIGILTQSGVLNISVTNGMFIGANSTASSLIANINLQVKF